MSSGDAGTPLRIGLSANFFGPDPQRRVYPHSRLLYFEEQMTGWFASQGAIVYGIPTWGGQGSTDIAAVVDDLDALALTGGADINPRTYREEPMRPEWEGQEDRDMYEVELVLRFIQAGKPVLGVCRGHQLLNVALGGTLYQDISTQVPGALEHRSQERYHNNLHEVDLVPGSSLASLYPGRERVLVNSVHHQAIKELGMDLWPQAHSHLDGVNEAVRLGGSAVGGPHYAMGIQWHPEFFALVDDERLLDNAPILAEFMAAAAERSRR